MTVARSDKVDLREPGDLVRLRQVVRTWMAADGFTLVDQTKMVTAVSEIGRNAIVHGGGGHAVVDSLLDSGRRGIRLVFEDHGPGIADLDLALKDGYTTGGGLGLGLGGARRLVQEFEIDSEVGRGTRVTITRWR